MTKWPGEGDTPRHTRVVQLLTQLKDVIGVQDDTPPERDQWSLAADLHHATGHVLKELNKPSGGTDATIFADIADMLLDEDATLHQKRRRR